MADTGTGYNNGVVGRFKDVPVGCTISNGKLIFSQDDIDDTAGSANKNYQWIWTAGSYEYETSWIIRDSSGNEIAASAAGETKGNGQAVFSPGTYTLFMSDTYGDGWNGNAITIRDVDASTTIINSATIESGSSNQVSFTVEDASDLAWHNKPHEIACSSSKHCIGWELYGDSVVNGENYIPELDTGGDFAPHGPVVEYSQKGGRKHYISNDCITYENDPASYLYRYYQSYQSTEYTHPGKSDGDYYCYLESIYPGKDFQPGDAACSDAVENPNQPGRIVSYDACKFYVQDYVDTRTAEESQLLADAYQKKVQYDNRNGLQRTCSLADLVMRDISWAYLDGQINPLEWEEKSAEASDNVEKCDTNPITLQKENCQLVVGTYYQHLYSYEIRLQKAYHSKKKKQSYILMMTHFSLEGHQTNKIGMITSLKFLSGATVEKVNNIKILLYKQIHYIIILNRL